jgi:hypothetical protein
VATTVMVIMAGNENPNQQPMANLVTATRCRSL